MIGIYSLVFKRPLDFSKVRNQYFYLGETILDEIPAAANFVRQPNVGATDFLFGTLL